MPSNRNLLRQTFRARRDALSPEERQIKSLAIAQKLVEHARDLAVRRVALFLSIGSEVSMAHALEALVAAGVECVLPRVVRPDAGLEFALHGEPLRPGALGVSEPQGPAVSLATEDLVVVPGLVFDRHGHRLGYGKGYYDRTLAGYAGHTAGVAFQLQVVEALPIEAHDVPVHVLITETNLYAMENP